MWRDPGVSDETLDMYEARHLGFFPETSGRRCPQKRLDDVIHQD
jgi:hypothetical protein